RDKFRLAAGKAYDLRPDQRVGEMGESYFAHQKLAWGDRYRFVSNYEDHLSEADAERDPDAILARKLLFYAKQYNKAGESPKALAYFEKAIPMWLDILLRYPDFSYSNNVQEEAYELELKYIRLLQREHAELWRALVMGMAQFSSWPYAVSYVPWHEL